MTRLPMLNARKLVAALKRAGFEETHYKGSHLYLHHPKKDLETCVPMHGGDLGRDLIRAILRQTQLTETEIRALL